jgi:hypothetical protein
MCVRDVGLTALRWIEYGLPVSSGNVSWALMPKQPDLVAVDLRGARTEALRQETAAIARKRGACPTHEEVQAGVLHCLLEASNRLGQFRGASARWLLRGRDSP